MKIIIIPVLLILSSCGNTDSSVKSPFSHLDTVTSKVIEKPKDSDGGVKSPFSGLDKK